MKKWWGVGLVVFLLMFPCVVSLIWMRQEGVSGRSIDKDGKGDIAFEGREGDVSEAGESDGAGAGSGENVHTEAGDGSGASGEKNAGNLLPEAGQGSIRGKEGQPPKMRRINVKRGGIRTYVELEEYLPGVVACQIPEGKEYIYDMETWKCQAVIARTYISRLMDGREEILEEELDLGYPGTYSGGLFGKRDAAIRRLELAEQAVEATRGVVMKQDGVCILPLFHQMSAGKTRRGDEGFSYLQAVDSSQDTREADCLQLMEWDAADFAARISGMPGAAPVSGDQLKGQIQTVAKDESGYLLQIQIGARTYTGDEVQAALGMPSTYFSLEVGEGKVTAVVRGRGHGYGLSQDGADYMAKNGWAWEDILYYYFKNIDLISE